MHLSRLARLGLLLVGLSALAGCASDPRHAKGLGWVVEQQAERDRLEAQGFPQYSYE